MIEALGPLVSLARAVSDFFRSRQAARVARIGAFIEYLDQLADTLDAAANEFDAGRAPYREYVELQRYSTKFPELVDEVFGNSSTSDSEQFAEILNDSIAVIEYSDLVLFGFRGVPVPSGHWSGKTPTLEIGDEANPSQDDAEFTAVPINRVTVTGGEQAQFVAPPGPQQLREAASALRAEAVNLRAITPGAAGTNAG